MCFSDFFVGVDRDIEGSWESWQFEECAEIVGLLPSYACRLHTTNKNRECEFEYFPALDFR